VKRIPYPWPTLVCGLLLGACDFSTPMPNGGRTRVGASCAASSQCSAGVLSAECVTEAQAQAEGFSAPGGYCTAVGCDLENPFGSCGTGATCVSLLPSVTGCFANCNTEADCREGYVCAEHTCRPTLICTGEGDSCNQGSGCCEGLTCLTGVCRAPRLPSPLDGGAADGGGGDCLSAGCPYGYVCDPGTGYCYYDWPP
jgi:hypothetical protein